MQDFSFSEQLIAETIACFQEEDGIVLTPEEASAFLENMAGLFLSFTRVSPEGFFPPVPSRRGKETLGRLT